MPGTAYHPNAIHDGRSHDLSHLNPFLFEVVSNAVEHHIEELKAIGWVKTVPRLVAAEVSVDGKNWKRVITSDEASNGDLRGPYTAGPFTMVRCNIVSIAESGKLDVSVSVA